MFANSRAILLTLMSFGLTVSGTPEVIKNFYEKILSSPGTTRPSNTTLNNTKRQFYNTVVYCHNSVATLNDSGDFFNLKQLRILPK